MQEIPAHPRECHEREIRLWRNCLSLCVSNSCDTRPDSRIARVNVERVLLTLNTVATHILILQPTAFDRSLSDISLRHMARYHEGECSRDTEERIDEA